MAITVYKKGNTHVENGIECKIARIEPSSLQPHLEAGWKLTPEEVGSPNPELIGASRPILKKPVVSEKVGADRGVLESVGVALNKLRGKA